MQVGTVPALLTNFLAGIQCSIWNVQNGSCTVNPSYSTCVFLTDLFRAQELYSNFTGTTISGSQEKHTPWNRKFPTVHSKGDLIMCQIFFSEWNSFKCQSTISISDSERDAQPPSIPFDAGTMDWLDKAPSQINLKSMSTVLVRL